MKVTGPDGDNPITDDQIRTWESDELQRLRSSTKRWAVVDLATTALTELLFSGGTVKDLRAAMAARKLARGQCADAWNARYGGES